MSLARFNLGQSLGIDPGGKQRAKVAAKMSASTGTGPVGTGPRPGSAKPSDATAKIDEIKRILGVAGLDEIAPALMDLLASAEGAAGTVDAMSLAAAGWSPARVRDFMTRRARR